MNSFQSKPKTISQYIKALPKEHQKKMREMLVCVRSAAPKAQEGIKWGMPAFSYNRILVMFGAFKNHIGFFPTGSVTRVFTKDLAKFKTGKGSIQFPLNKPLPKLLVKKITKYRIKENLEKDKKWRT
ncbi:MAG TPA: DUF1801 domain-containing protein [Candidatus Limnocylindria bacterium]|nr:DUF1801 domain-containing protein [Candidatus Limnocylindria bacterium]